MTILLGVDIGTTGTKTLAINARGEVLAQASAHYTTSHPEPGWSQQAPSLWWDAAVQTIRAVLDKLKAPKQRVAAIGLSGQMHGSVFLNAQQEVIRPALLWNDQRTAAQCADIESLAGGRTQLIKYVANPALTGFTAPKILWLRDNEPQNYEQTKHILLPKDYVRLRLTGDFATEVSDASGTLLLDVAHRRWSKELLTDLRIDGALLPRCVESEDVTGSLTPEAAELLGLTTNCKVVGGAGDCAAFAVGTGAVRPGVLAASIGSSGVMFVHSDTMEFDPQGRLHTFCHAARGKWHMMGVTLSAGAALDWFRANLCPELERVAGWIGDGELINTFELLTREAERVPVGAEGLTLLPYFQGERTPHANPNARACFLGLTLKHGRGHLTRAILEGVTYALRDSLEIFRGLGVPVHEIRAIGGGAKSPFWRQIQANVFGQSVHTVNAEEGPAYGVALLAAVGAGVFSNIQEACAATIRATQETRVDEEARKQYDALYPRFVEFYRGLEKFFPKP